MLMSDENIAFPPNMKKVFDQLSTGYHICIEDGEIYVDLTKNIDFYRELFSVMGFKLSAGSEGIFYFLPEDEKKTNEMSKKFMLFVAIMYDWLADQGKEPVSSLTENHFYIDQLPHLSNEHYKKTMAELKVRDKQALDKIVHNLERYGFLYFIDGNMIKFRKTVSRFVTILSEVSESKDCSDKGNHDE